MKRIEERAKEMGYRQLYLETGYAQPEAVELYRTTGWIAVAEYPPGAHSHHLASRFMKDL